jgi:hypothetical protein
MNVVFLILYALALSGGIIFLLIRLVFLFLRNRQGQGSGLIF